MEIIIFSYLGPDDLGRAERVSKLFQLLANMNQFWFHFSKQFKFQIINAANAKPEVIANVEKCNDIALKMFLDQNPGCRNKESILYTFSTLIPIKCNIFSKFKHYENLIKSNKSEFRDCYLGPTLVSYHLRNTPTIYLERAKLLLSKGVTPHIWNFKTFVELLANGYRRQVPDTYYLELEVMSLASETFKTKKLDPKEELQLSESFTIVAHYQRPDLFKVLLKTGIIPDLEIPVVQEMVKAVKSPDC